MPLLLKLAHLVKLACYSKKLGPLKLHGTLDPAAAVWVLQLAGRYMHYLIPSSTLQTDELLASENFAAQQMRACSRLSHLMITMFTTVPSPLPS